MVLMSLYGPHVIVYVPDNVGCASNVTTDGVLWYVLPDLDQGFTELLPGGIR